MEWQINKSAKSCIHCDMSFGEDEEYFSALYDIDDIFTRRDYCFECWSKATDEGVFSYWKTKVQKKPVKEQRYANIDVFYDLFLRTEDEKDLSRVNFRYVLSLYLMRKKVLKLQETLKSNGDEFLILHDLNNEGRETRVLKPLLGAEELNAVTEEIGKLLNCTPQL